MRHTYDASRHGEGRSTVDILLESAALYEGWAKYEERVARNAYNSRDRAEALKEAAKWHQRAEETLAKALGEEREISVSDDPTYFAPRQERLGRNLSPRR